MNEEVAIKVEGVYKNFVLPHEKVSSVKSLFTKGFRKSNTEVQHALKDINFEIKKGEFFGIVGRNGSGKSTLLKIIAGIYQPTKGIVKTNGKLVPFIELGVGFNPELTGRENVYLNGAILGFTTKQVTANYTKIVEFAELEEFMDQKLKNYSSGMQVRLAFACATMAEADILLIDEVLAVGDADFQRKCFNYFKQLKKLKKTVIFVTHDMEAVKEYCDRAALIDESNLRLIGSTFDIARDYIRLFDSSKDTLVNSEDTRWGSGLIKIESIKAESKRDKIVITEKIKAYADVDNYIAGIRIRNSEGHGVAGTNTKIQAVPLAPIKKGSSVVFSWEFDNVLSDGRYVIDPAISYENGIDMYDWWDDACLLHVKKKRHTPYPIDLEFKVSISKK